MRLFIFFGIALIIVGVLVFDNGGAFTTHREVLNVGPLTMTAEEQHPVGPWIAGLAVAAGVALLATGVRRTA